MDAVSKAPDISTDAMIINGRNEHCNDKQGSHTSQMRKFKGIS